MPHARHPDPRHNSLAVEHRPIGSLKPLGRRARVHSKAQIRQIADSLTAFGWINPVIVDDADRILAGHGRVEAARLLGQMSIPVIPVAGMSEAAKRAYVLADNRIAESAGWDRALLALELGELADLLPEISLDLAITGFDIGEIDGILADMATSPPAIEDLIEEPDRQQVPVSRPGDLWQLGSHRLICADARDSETYETLLAGELADLIFTDPPYNVPIDGHVGGRGRIRHREFACASGEMTPEAFTAFLREVLCHLADHSRDGSIHYICMDWRHIGELMAAGANVYSALKNLCVWTKSNAGQGSFYRSQHELVFVYKRGEAAHVNSFGLGAGGRTRSNVWPYAGVNSFRAGRMDELTIHPTVKPVALVADALRDCSRHGDRVLDAFAGSGTTLIAAEMLGRRGYGVEIDPLYVDAALGRWMRMTKRDALLTTTGETFAEVRNRRSPDPLPVEMSQPLSPSATGGADD